jgi:UPF0755 protein
VTARQRERRTHEWESSGVRPRDRESVPGTEAHGAFADHPFEDESLGADPFGDSFGDSDGYLLDDYDSAEDDDGHLRRSERARTPRTVRLEHSRSSRHAHTRRRRNRRFALILAVLVVVVVAVSSYLIVLPIYHYLHPADYSGAGTGQVLVTVQSGDDASAIGTTLHDRGVVASVRAFTDAAGKNAKSQDIQPGSYRLHRHMSAKAALGLLLDPAARVKADVLVPEGATTLDVEKRMTLPQCTGASSASTACGPGYSKAAVTAALHDIKALGLPTDYTVNGRSPSSAEGFLFPATYFFPSRMSASTALQQMISRFTDQARSSDFTARARALHISPYQELIIASIAQSEAKFPEDYPKVARVILNRIAAHKPLQIDATSAYGAKLQGLDPAKIDYAHLDSPYNSYVNAGLPPTPIGNPGAEAMDAASRPATGNWLFYVNGSADGHLFFTNSEAAFVKAVATCKARHWGCA